MSAPLPFSFVLSPPLLASLLLAILPALFLRSSALFPSVPTYRESNILRNPYLDNQQRALARPPGSETGQGEFKFVCAGTAVAQA